MIDLVGCAGFWNLDNLDQHWVRRDCLEAYHVECVAKDESFVESGNSWTCKWHSCFICCKSSKFHCFCCLKAVCQHFIATAEFARVRRNKGFCNHYLKFALLREENMDVNSDGVLLFGDGSDLKTQQCSKFKQSSKSETTNPITTRRGKIRMSEGKGVVMKRVVKSNGKGEWEGSCDEKGGKVQREGSCDEKGGKIQREGSCDEKGGKVQREGSCDEMGGKIQREGSCDEKGVSCVTWRKILCDERLKSVLGQKTVYRNQMCDLLQPHFIENLESSDEDELGLSSEAEDKNVMVACKKQRELITNRKSLEKEVVINAPQSCFASIVSENIKLVYLKRSLVQELVKQPETFENKLIGSFVRVKLDPNDSFQRNSHQLVRVTGIKKISKGDNNTQILLQVSNMSKTFASACFQMFSSLREECEDLSQKVKDGLLKKPTIAFVLVFNECVDSQIRQDLPETWSPSRGSFIAFTAHFSDGALSRLLDRAIQEGLLDGFLVGSLTGAPICVSHLLYADDALIFCGARAEQVGYLRCVLLCFEVVSSLRVNFRKSELIPVGQIESLLVLAAALGCQKRQLPQKPSEQSRLLQVVPKVIADVSELETMANDAIKENKQGDESLPKSILLGSSAISGDSSKGSGFSSGETVDRKRKTAYYLFSVLCLVAKKKRFLASIIEELDRLEPTLRETKRPRQFS
ncbi:unnamed protein product [Camellia sinensis]